MKRYTTAQARQRFAELLNTVAAGQPVVIERRGVRFILQVDRPVTRRRRRRQPTIVSRDPAVAAGQWTWEWNEGGLEFVPRNRRR